MTAAATPDLNELRAFCAAAELGTVGRAAIRLHVSQPALSKRLAALEPRSARGCSSARRRACASHPPDGASTGTRARCSRPRTGSARSCSGSATRRDVVRLAASHSATEAFAAAMLGGDARARAHGRARDGELAGRPGAGRRRPRRPRRRRVAARPHAGPGRARERPRRRRDRLRRAARATRGPAGAVALDRFLATPMVVRDPSSNARWTVEAVLAARGLAGGGAARGGGNAARGDRGGAGARRAGAAQPPHRRADRLHRRSRSRSSPSRAATCSSPRARRAGRRRPRARRAHPRARADLAPLDRGRRGAPGKSPMSSGVAIRDRCRCNDHLPVPQEVPPPCSSPSAAPPRSPSQRWP